MPLGGINGATAGGMLAEGVAATAGTASAAFCISGSGLAGSVLCASAGAVEAGVATGSVLLVITTGVSGLSGVGLGADAGGSSVAVGELEIEETGLAGLTGVSLFEAM